MKESVTLLEALKTAQSLCEDRNQQSLWNDCLITMIVSLFGLNPQPDKTSEPYNVEVAKALGWQYETGYDAVYDKE